MSHQGSPRQGCISTSMHGGWELFVWGLENNPWARTAVGYGEKAWRNGNKEIHNREDLWRKTRWPWKQGAESHTACGATIVDSLILPQVPALAGEQWRNTLARAALWVHDALRVRDRRGRVALLTPSARGYKRLLIEPYVLCQWPLASLCTRCTEKSPHDPSSHTTSSPYTHWSIPRSSRATSGAHTCGWPISRGGDKTTIELQSQND